MGGSFHGAVDFNPGLGEDEHISKGDYGDAFLVKLDRSGAYEWGSSWGDDTIFDDQCTDIATDELGNVYATGVVFVPRHSDPATNVEEALSPVSDAYVRKFNPDGGMEWIRSWGGPGDLLTMNRGSAIAVDEQGSIICAGEFSGTVDFDPGPGTEYRSSGGPKSVFIVKFSSNGDLLWVQALLGSSFSSVSDLTIDTAGNIIVTGDFNDSIGYRSVAGSEQRDSAGGTDVFICKFTPQGEFDWISSYGGAEDEFSHFVGLSGDYDICLGDAMKGQVNRDSEAANDGGSSGDESCIYLSTFDSDGQLKKVQTCNVGSEEVADMVLDSSGQLYVTGRLPDSREVEGGTSAESSVSSSPGEFFISKFTEVEGCQVQTSSWEGVSKIPDWSEMILDYGSTIAIDAMGRVLVAGSVSGRPDFGRNTRVIEDPACRRIKAFLVALSWK
jgi:hypothetical protein